MEYGYLDLDYNLDLPQLVLAVDQGSFDYKEPELWLPIVHQAGGLLCSQVKLRGMVLPIRAEKEAAVQTLSDKWYDSQAQDGAWGQRLSVVEEYSRDLASLFGASCETSFSRMQEAVYPMDYDPKLLAQLTDVEFPQNLKDLLVFSDKISKLSSYTLRFQIYILGENSD